MVAVGGSSDTLYVEDLPESLARQLDLDDRTKKDAVVAALRREYGTTDQSRLEMRLDHRRERRRMLVDEREDLQREINQLDEEIEALESQLQDVQASEENYADNLDEILDGMVESGMHVFPGHGKVESVAEAHDLRAEGVVEDLKERSEERDLPLSENHFSSAGGRR